jgi:alpha-L-rhamnosidase
MNIGQVLEVHLGIAAREMGFKVMTPAFDGAKESDITEMLTEAGLYRNVLPSDALSGKKFYEMIVNEETGEVDNNSQTSLACVIFHNLVSRKVGKKIARRLAASVKKAGYHYYAGVLGCKYIFSALSEYGYTDVAYKAIVNPDYPSYANWIARGATTMWEDWNDGFSRNHHMYSDVIGWMYKYLAGIKTDEKNPGYRRFFVEPKVIDDLSYVQAETESPFGKIVAGWKKENGTLTVTVTVPYGTTAVLTMPNGAKKELVAGTYTETCSL